MNATHLLIAVLFTAFFAACDKGAFLPEAEHKVQVDDRSKAPDDLCATTFCPPNSICINGQCLCDQGWEGLACSKGYSDKFVGAYQQIDTCDTGILYSIGPVTVIKMDNQTIRIDNFGAFGSYAIAKVEKATTDQTIATQITIDSYDNVGRYFKGLAMLKNGLVHGIYTVTYSDGSMETCSFEWHTW